MKVSTESIDQHSRLTVSPECTVWLGCTEREGVRGSCPKEKRHDERLARLSKAEVVVQEGVFWDPTLLQGLGCYR